MDFKLNWNEHKYRLDVSLWIILADRSLKLLRAWSFLSCRRNHL